MDIYKFNYFKNYSEDFNNGSILLLGEFEIFHKGHEKLLEEAKKSKTNEKIGIFIIDNIQKKDFQTLTNRLNYLSHFMFDFIVIAKFNYEFKSLDGGDFIKALKKQFNVKKFIVGEDFRFGKDRQYSANDIKNIFNYETIIINIFTFQNKKISTSSIIRMHEFGEYNIISNLLSYPLTFDILIENQTIKWIQKCSKPHYGIYYFQLLVDQYWYSGIIHFSINNEIKYNLINFSKEKEIFDQDSKVKILNIERVITNSRFDQINDDDIEQTKHFFNKY